MELHEPSLEILDSETREALNKWGISESVEQMKHYQHTLKTSGELLKKQGELRNLENSANNCETVGQNLNELTIKTYTHNNNYTKERRHIRNISNKFEHAQRIEPNWETLSNVETHWKQQYRIHVDN